MPFASTFVPPVYQPRGAARARRPSPAPAAAPAFAQSPALPADRAVADSAVADRACDIAVARAVEAFDVVLVASACVLWFPERFFPFAGPLLALWGALAVLALGWAVRPLGRLAGAWVQAHAGRGVRLAAGFALLAGGTVAMALVPAYGAAGLAAIGLLALCRVAQGLALGAGSSRLDGGSAASGAAQVVGGTGGALLAGTLLATLALALSGPDLRAWGWQLPFVLVLPIHLVALFARLRCG